MGHPRFVLGTVENKQPQILVCFISKREDRKRFGGEADRS